MYCFLRRVSLERDQQLAESWFGGKFYFPNCWAHNHNVNAYDIKFCSTGKAETKRLEPLITGFGHGNFYPLKSQSHGYADANIGEQACELSNNTYIYFF